MESTDQVRKVCWAAALNENGLEIVATFLSEESRASFIERANGGGTFPYREARAVDSNEAARIGSEPFEGGDNA